MSVTVTSHHSDSITASGGQTVPRMIICPAVSDSHRDRDRHGPSHGDRDRAVTNLKPPPAAAAIAAPGSKPQGVGPAPARRAPGP